MKLKIQSLFAETRVLLRAVPPLCLTFFVLAVFGMNLLANKSVNLPVDWLALDCGIVLSWAVFLCMDVLTRHFGPRAATVLSLGAAAINLLACLFFYLTSFIPGTWGAFYDFGELPEINSALDKTFGGTWYVVLGSTIAFAVSAAINNFSNWGVGKLFRKNPDGLAAYLCRTHVSTAIGQFADNLIFAFLVSHFFFGWTVLQCFTCAATGCVAELLCEAVFSPLGYVVCKRWKADDRGREYFEFLAKKTQSGAEGGEMS